MNNYFVKRLIMGFLGLIVVSVVVFAMVHITKGDPVNLLVNPLAGPEVRETVRSELGFDKPLITQYFIYMKRLFTGDLGDSFRTNEPVTKMVGDRIGLTLQLGLSSFFISLIMGVGLGILAAVKSNTIVDTIIMFLSVLFIAVPAFWVGLIFILTFSIKFKVFPSSGYGTIKHLVMPTIVLSLEGIGIFTRMARASFVEVLNSNFVTSLRARGLSYNRILYIHVLKNGLIPIISLAGLRLGAIIAGSIVVVEYVFSLPGVGKLLLDSIFYRDYAPIQSITFLVSAFAIIVNMIADFVYALVNPKIRY